MKTLKLVTESQANLLSKLGFNYPCLSYYQLSDAPYIKKGVKINNHNLSENHNKANSKYVVSAPTLELAIQFLITKSNYCLTTKKDDSGYYSYWHQLDLLPKIYSGSTYSSSRSKALLPMMKRLLKELTLTK